VGGHIVANEVRWNADVPKRCEEGAHVPSEDKTVQLEGWRDRRNEMGGLSAEAPELWQASRRRTRRLNERGRAAPPRNPLSRVCEEDWVRGAAACLDDDRCEAWVVGRSDDLQLRVRLDREFCCHNAVDKYGLNSAAS